MAVAVAGEEGNLGRWGMAAGVEKGSLLRWGMVAAAGAGCNYLAAAAGRDAGGHLRSRGDLEVEGRHSSRRGLGGCCFRRRRIGCRTGRARKALEGGVQEGGELLPGNHQPGGDRRSRRGGEVRSLLVPHRTAVLGEDSPAVEGSLEVGSRLERGSRSSESTGCMGRTWCLRVGLSVEVEDSEAAYAIITAVDLKKVLEWKVEGWQRLL
jgi:hypothetical protein